MSSNRATLDSLLSQMHQNKDVLQGWDAVLNLLKSSVDQFLLLQWRRLTGGANRMRIATAWCEGVHPIPDMDNLYFTTVYGFQVELGAPLFQFESGQAQVAVRHDILSGSLRVGTMRVPATFKPSAGVAADDARIRWGQPEAVNIGSSPTLSGKVALSQVRGLVNPTANSVVLDFAQGAFSLDRLGVTGLPPGNLASAIRNWFATNRITYCLASVDFASVGAPSGLTPKAFRFHVASTSSGNTIVQLFISTSGAMPSSIGVHANDPIPTADGYTCSLMVSSRLLYQEILVPGFNLNGGHFTLRPIPMGSAWTAWLNPPMVFSGSFSYGNCCNRTTVTYNIVVNLTFSGSQRAGFAVSQHIQASGPAPVAIDVSGSYPITLSGSGAAQTVHITSGPLNVSVSGSVENELRAGLQHVLQTNIRNTMTNVSFRPVSLLALQSLLFPGHLMVMRQVQVPSDLLVVGTFTPR